MALLSMADLLELAPGVRTIAQQVAKHIGTTPGRLVIGDAYHEELSEGAYSIAYEGAYEWPYTFTTDVYEGKITIPGGWHLECLTGWAIACYPDND